VEVYEKLEALASATARTKSFVALEALSTYLQAQGWQVQDIEAGLLDAERGDFASEAEVAAVFARHGA
jgi:predicted transcriptional regulator